MSFKMSGAREKILVAAEELFIHGGYHGTGTNAIIAAAGVAKATFFSHFPQKIKLVDKLLATYVQRDLIEPLETAFSVNDDPVDALCSYVDMLHHWHQANGFRGGCLLGNLSLELADGPEGMRTTLERHFAAWQAILRRNLEPSYPKSKVEAFLPVFVALIEGVTMITRVQRRPEDAEIAFEAISDTVRALLGRTDENLVAAARTSE